MKNLIKKSLLIAIFAVSTIVIANGNDPSIKISIVKSKLVHLTLAGNLNNVELSVVDKYGVVLHNETIQNSNFSKNFNLESLPNGKYSIVVESLTNIKTIPFVVSANTVSFNKKNEEVYSKPVIRLNGSAVFISQLALKNESLEISVFNEYNDLVYGEVLHSKSLTLKRKLSFKNLESGNYKLVLRSGGKSFYKVISI